MKFIFMLFISLVSCSSYTKYCNFNTSDDAVLFMQLEEFDQKIITLRRKIYGKCHKKEQVSLFRKLKEIKIMCISELQKIPSSNSVIKTVTEEIIELLNTPVNCREKIICTL
ncbi:MAG: hypothetical protein JXR95_15770 [Deltaproteobacteria bacterium]|nr:hypothetical protein [Deltaproteobacteria bacterium]